MCKKTKIIATISDLRCEPDFIQSLWDEGMNAVRINTAHATYEGAARIVDNVRKVSDQIAIMIDTKGPEIRLTDMAEECRDGIPVRTGDTVRFAGTADDAESTPDLIYMNYAGAYEDIPVGARILLDDGEIEISVTGKADGVIEGRINNSGIIKGRKSVNIPGVDIDLPSVSDRDREYIEWAIGYGIDFIAHSFVRRASDVQAVKEILEVHNSPIKIISKIENEEGFDNLDEILIESYGVMVARGDLGVEIPAEKIPVIQREIVNRCIESKTPVIIATQMLHSMIEHPRPTRAEVSDIANAIYQRVDAIMLSGETASGHYPTEAVRTMASVAREIEHDLESHTPNYEMNMVRIDNEITVQLARSAVRATFELPVRAVVIDTMSGRTGRYLSAFRGGKPVYAVCYRRSVMRQLGISYGIYPIYIEPVHGKDNFLLRSLQYLEYCDRLIKEDLVVVVGGSFGDEQGASFMEIGTVLNLESKASRNTFD
ncbi:pyruvate kinase [Alistipes sp. OttesenSCG-928-B03]|nr:pyruvate kinase [Alistipes sp. OttesenSCG-928-B03]